MFYDNLVSQQTQNSYFKQAKFQIKHIQLNIKIRKRLSYLQKELID